MDPADIHNWRRISGLITTSGQPSEAGLARIGALGVTHVINLGLHDHAQALADERATVTGLGMMYLHIPVDFGNPREEDFERFCAAMRALSGTAIHVHCIANFRVSAFVYRYRRDVLMEDEGAAYADLMAVWQPSGAWVAFVA